MAHPKTFAIVLEEFKQRATGKDPFGPITDIKRFYESLEETERSRFATYLSSLARDKFWADYITMFDQWREEKSLA